GDRDKTKRPLMASIALKYADEAIFTSDNPRTEDPQAILDDMTEGLDGTHYTVIENRKDAIFHSINLAEIGDIVLIAGKGHETYEDIGRNCYDFNYREVAKEAILAKENQCCCLQLNGLHPYLQSIRVQQGTVLKLPRLRQTAEKN